MPRKHDREEAITAQKDVGLNRPVVLAAAAACALLAGCGKPSTPAQAPAATRTPAQSDYVAPPEVTGVSGDPGRMLVLQGAAQPQARIRLASADGAASGATAGPSGAWTLPIAPASTPRLFSLAADMDGRTVPARGYLALLPGGEAAMLRPAAGARPMIPPGAPPRIGAVDFDAAGAGVVSGRARPDRPVRVLLDGQDAGEGRTDRNGWFDVSLSDNLKPGRHAVAVGTADGRADAAFDGAHAAPIAAPPMNAARVDGGWRLDWMSPGGGVQSTVLFDQAPIRSAR